MKRTIIFFVLTLISIAIWASNIFSSSIVTTIDFGHLLLLVIGIGIIYIILRFILLHISRKNTQFEQILNMPMMLKRVASKIATHKKEYFETIIKKDIYPDWVVQKLNSISTELDKDDFFDTVEILIFKSQSEKSFDTQKTLYNELLNAENRIQTVMKAIHSILMQNCMYQIEAPAAIQSVADHLKELRSSKVDISDYNIRLKELADLFEYDDKSDKEVFDGCKQLLKEIPAL